MTISEDPNSSEMLDKQQQKLIAELLRGLSKSTQKDIHAMLFLICKEELKEQAGSGSALEDAFLILTREEESSVEMELRQLHQETDRAPATTGD